ncbi:MAG: flagellar biosynthesis protein FlgN [Treponema sp.]|jgi:hypothetical protein|nr:flagellar biosynthesis protein FlgN [Treponema sp.]
MTAAQKRLKDKPGAWQRAAILKRFQELLYAQQERFRLYLEVLDKQGDTIERGRVEDSIVYVEIAEKIVMEIFSIQKVMGPLEAMYRAAYPGSYAGTGYGLSEEAAGIQRLISVLEQLKTEAVGRSKRNKALLAKWMTALRFDIQALRKNPYTGRRSVYSSAGMSSLLDMQG